MDDDSENSEISRAEERASEIAFLRAAARTPEGGPRGAESLVGTQLGRYRVEKVIGHGGMGVVFRATDLALRRDVALKVLREDVMTDPKRRKRFLREARLAASISHPNVATIHDVGEHQDRVFLAMELLPHETLRERMRKGPLPIRDVLVIGAAIASGAAKAHEAGVVHRDLKPDNISVGTGGTVKVLDFGLAKARGDAMPATQSAVETEPGQVLGTPAYMSPEQARGGDVRESSDVFSFGVLLYEMTAGVRPFDASTVTEVLEAHARASRAPLTKHRADAPRALLDVVDRCLEPRPEERPRMAEVAAALLGAAERPRRPRLLWYAVGVVLAIAAFAAAAWSLSR